MLNPIEKFKVTILHLNRDWNHCYFLDPVVLCYQTLFSQSHITCFIIHVTEWLINKGGKSVGKTG